MRLIFLLIFLCFSQLSAQKVVYTLAAQDVSALQAEEVVRESPLFASAIPLSISSANGVWARQDAANGRWELGFQMAETHGLALYLDQLNLPEGGKLFLEALQDGQTIRTQPQTAASASARNRIFTGFLPAKKVTLVYEGPVFPPETAAFRIWRADQVFRPDIFAPQKQLQDFGNSNACQINANCPAGEGWEEEKSSAARILVVVAEGTGYCSGTLMNNTAEDGRPLFLTGYHCQDGFTPLYDLWRFDFAYTALGCENPAAAPSFTAYLGALARSGSRAHDFLLLELTDATFDASTHYFAGWDRSDGQVSGTILGFHHPMGDIQKLGRSNGMNIFNNTITWSQDLITPAGYHFRMLYNLGTFQVGSSGSSVYDSNRRLRGYLSGGNPSCPGTTEAFIGRLFQAWSGDGLATNRLSDWLDPLGLEPLTLDGRRLQGNGIGRLLNGQINFADSPVENVRLIFQWGSQTDTVFTNSQGQYSLQRPEGATALNIATSYEFGDALTGVNVVDIVAIRRHILAFDTLSPLQLVAADVTNDGQVSIGDIVRISQLILGLREWEFRPNWFVLPALLNLDPTPAGAFGPFDISINNPNAGLITLDFELVKNGDVNFDGR